MRIYLLRLGIAVYIAASTSSAAQAQQTCGDAVSQLQSYVASVNQFANAEYFHGIPMRCGGNPNCQQWWFQHLNGWYMNQSGMVNQWYMQIQANCTSQSSRKKIKEIDNDGAPGLDEDEVASIDVDDEDRTVKIKIPNDAVGYRTGR